MAERETNPYKNDTPEWQLFENAKSSDAAANAYAADADNFTKKSQAAREKAQRFWSALERLTAAGHGA